MGGHFRLKTMQTPKMNDWELLKAYAVDHSERAFDLLVEPIMVMTS